MVTPTLCGSRNGVESLGDRSEAPIADYLETIAILQDEVARLEQELQLSNQRQRETPSIDEASLHDEAAARADHEHVAGDSGEVERFQAELVSRDETIRLLMDELIRVEEAQAATRAEWEQLDTWVAELEHRVEGHDENGLRELENRLALEQSKVDSLQAKSERDRRAAEAQRQMYQAEIARLQETLAELVNSAKNPVDADGTVRQDPAPTPT